MLLNLPAYESSFRDIRYLNFSFLTTSELLHNFLFIIFACLTFDSLPIQLEIQYELPSITWFKIFLLQN